MRASTCIATSSTRRRSSRCCRASTLAVGAYFDDEPVTDRWTFGNAPPELRDRHDLFTVTYARRTLAGWFDAVAGAGLAVEALAEPRADAAIAVRHPEVADTRIVPYFLIIRARKTFA